MKRIDQPMPGLRRARRTGRRTALSLAAIAVLGTAAAEALAADEGPAAPASSPVTNSEPVQLERIVVSAQKREEASIDVPASVTAIRASRLARGGLKRIEDYAAEVPGMSFASQRQGMTQVTLRGITTGTAQSAATTSFYIDEAPVGSMNAYAAGSLITPDVDPAELRQIEILKGPQGTLYGAGALGGIVRYVTAPPNHAKFSGSMTLGISAVEHGGTGQLARGSVNVPIDGESLALRVNVFRRDDAGFIANPASGQKQVNEGHVEGGRVALGWKPLADWSVLASVFTQKIKSDGPSVVDVDHASLQPLAGDLTHASYVPEPGHVNLNVYNATVKGRLGDYSLVSSTTYEAISSANEQDGTPLYGALLGPLLGVPTLGVAANTLIDTKRWTQELRLRSSALEDRLEYEGGVFLTREVSGFLIPGFVPFDTTTGATIPLPPIVKASIDSTYREASVFANATYAITPELSLQAGVRYAEDWQKYAQVYEGLIVGPTPVVLNKSSGDKKATWMAGARWKPTVDDAVYVRAANGYRPGGPNAVPPAGVPGAQQTFEPDSLTSYELGYKANLARGRLSFETALFDTTWKNIQISTSAQGYNFFVNGGTARSRGAEATLYWVPVAGLNLRAAVAYTDAYLTSDAPAAGGLDKDRLPFVPKLTASLSADYRWAVTDGWSATAGGSVNFTGDRVSTFSQKHPVNAPSFTMLNLNLGLEAAVWRFSLYAKNLSDKRGIVSITAAGISPLSNPYLAGVIAPRTVGAEATYSF